VPIWDFTLNDNQRRLRREARQFAKDVLSGVPVATRDLPSPIERFVATRPFYERLVADGFLRKCIPVSVGGDCAGLVDLAILAEEFYTVDANVSLTMLSTVLGLCAAGGWRQTRAAPTVSAALSCGQGLHRLPHSLRPEPGGSANVGSLPPGEEGVRTTARRFGDSWVISGRKQWISAATGWNGQGADLLTVVLPHRCQRRTLAWHLDHRCASSRQRPDFLSTHSTCWDTVPISRRASAWTLFRFRPEICWDKRGADSNWLRRALRVAALSSVSSVVALMRAAFQFALSFAKSEKRGGIQQIIQHQAVGYALADAKTTIEAARVLSWHACRALDTAAPGALELAIHTKVFGSEAAVRVITNLMQVVGVDSYGHELPLAGLLQDAMALPLFAGGNIGVRRRQLHALMLDPAL